MKTFLVGLLFCSQALGQLVLRPSTKYAADNVLEQTNAAPILANLTAPRYVSTFSDLTACGTDGPNVVVTLGYAAAGDGGGGTWNRVAAATYTADGGTFVDGVGCQWVRTEWLQQGWVRASWYGAVGDDSTDDTAALQAALNAGERVIIDRPPGRLLSADRQAKFRVSDTLVFPAPNHSMLQQEPETQIVATWGATDYRPILQIGTTGTTRLHAKFTGLAAYKLYSTTWSGDTTTNSAAVVIYTPYKCIIDIKRVAHGTVGIKTIAEDGLGSNADANWYTIDESAGSMIDFLVTGTGNWNGNNVYGGYLSTFNFTADTGAANLGHSMTHVVLESTAGNAYAHHDNRFYGQSFVKSSYRAWSTDPATKLYSVYITHGKDNHFFPAYLEHQNVIMYAGAKAVGNLVDVDTYPSDAKTDILSADIEGPGAYLNKVVWKDGRKYAQRLVYDSGPIAQSVSESASGVVLPKGMIHVVNTTTTNDLPATTVTATTLDVERTKAGGFVGVLQNNALGFRLDTKLVKGPYNVVADFPRTTITATITSGDSNVVNVSDMRDIGTNMTLIVGRTITTGTRLTNITSTSSFIMNAVPPSYTSSTRSRAANVARVATSAANYARPGDTVTITGLADASFNVVGATITAVYGAPSATAIYYDNVGSPVSSTADTGGTVLITRTIPMVWAHTGTLRMRILNRGNQPFIGSGNASKIRYPDIGEVINTDATGYGGSYYWSIGSIFNQDRTFTVADDVDAVEVFWQAGTSQKVRLRRVWAYCDDVRAGQAQPLETQAFGTALAAPTNGVWTAGDFLRNLSQTSVSQPLGWLCTASGSYNYIGGTVNLIQTNTVKFVSFDTPTHNIKPFDYIETATMAKSRVVWIDPSWTNAAVTVAPTSDATNAVSFSAPTFVPVGWTWGGTSAAPPTNPVDGLMYRDTDDGKVYVYNAGTTSWEALN